MSNTHTGIILEISDTKNVTDKFQKRRFVVDAVYSGQYGESISPGAWTFTPGRWQHLEQEVIVNHLGAFDGVLRVWVDGELVVNQNDMLYRVADNVLVAGLMFSTFFGGHDPSWASPRTQAGFFRNFQFFGTDERQ